MIGLISSKGKVVIPAPMRKKYNLEAGDSVELVDYGGVISLVHLPSNSIRHSRGLLAGKTSLTQALLADRSAARCREGKK